MSVTDQEGGRVGGMVDGCAFCVIVDSDPHGQVLQRWGDAVMIEPLNPVTPGHRLFIPTTHVRDATVSPLNITGRTVAWAAQYAGTLGSDSNIITSVGPAATQTVFHLHVHVVPRFEGDGLNLPWTGQHPDFSHCVGCGKTRAECDAVGGECCVLCSDEDTNGGHQ